MLCKLLPRQRLKQPPQYTGPLFSVDSLANKFIALTGQVDVDVVWSVMDCPYLNRSVLDCLNTTVIVDGVGCTSDHRRLFEVSSLALRNPKKASVNADQFSMIE